ncbi:bifunctional [glutamine synthetase] adenylyltransferase/[glutamine synthetase]-adenylyl-L-tyrosine phosphorylase [Sphingomonas naphthae]|uniref:Bifunctional [glutamine synthetase] adenylyltransferase/[glutamine synthetase]-adenylyl-L-tyrosine phosphorylase n=1 Tax=Sphingomonas naphthae TaxID=1813468 RepID=A0ABY7TNE1_9SPHN|nr:bifunctional [glutamine synthetase] adenylyltransferase/[glutamine synthetase]-adenylyl-L-tyrosine phosphorylase [Sphingomonas naphthae]WCT73374.1 bifunctional [glutamine synthetase] adenylyltransferase/[glutamine synthetase]-adenylyl-L-tyrosine phosphorylase [Sphingomonas naphthae]
MTQNPLALADALSRIERDAPFLRLLAQRRPEVVARIEADGVAAAIAAAGAEAAEDPTPRALRRERQAVALAVAVGDLAGLLTMEQVTRALSDFADRALDRAIRAAILERTPDAEPVGMAALALGKHGSRELNYSSDIDPILIFDPATLPLRPNEDPGEAAVRIARRVVELLQAREADGYVLRVDLRLRPTPEASPLAVPYAQALLHYESSALPWERAAFIRARAAAGDVALGARFLDQIRPFVWRRSLDFGAIGEIRALSRRIRGHYAQGQALGPGYDVKRGRGGIREVEFFAQIHQLIHGGREPGLRAPATLDALAALAGAGRIGRDEAVVLGDAYRLLRTIEHRLQMIDDQQTHRLPRDPAALDGVARLHGLAHGAALLALLAPTITAVGHIYDALEDEAAPGLPQDGDALEGALAALGFTDAGGARARVAGWRAGDIRALRSPQAQAALEEVLPGLAAVLGAAPDPAHAINRFDDLVRALPSAINLFRLLEARPALLALLADILSHAPALAAQLGRRADLLDGLIDATSLTPPPDVATLTAQFSARERGDDYERLLDSVRRQVSERRFALGVQLIEAASDAIEVARGHARVAEAALAALGAAAVAEFEAAHGRVPGGELVILALGRFGGGSLTHASDLDLIYLFTGDHAAESDGRRPLGATQYFQRLASRVSAALSVPTAAGPLYEVDTRLRPSGTQGLLAVSLDSFARYQAESAWTWEHMALTRARAVFGSDAARAEVAAIIAATLDRPREDTALTADVVKMRGDVARHKPPAGPLDVKLIAGGLIDAEFTVHLLQLRHRTAFDPRLRRAAAALAEAGLLDPGFAAAHELMTRLLVTLRLVSPGSEAPADASRPIVARACGLPDWAALMAAYADARALVAGEWRRVARLDMTPQPQEE